MMYRTIYLHHAQEINKFKNSSSVHSKLDNSSSSTTCAAPSSRACVRTVELKSRVFFPMIGVGTDGDLGGETDESFWRSVTEGAADNPRGLKSVDANLPMEAERMNDLASSSPELVDREETRMSLKRESLQLLLIE